MPLPAVAYNQVRSTWCGRAISRCVARVYLNYYIHQVIGIRQTEVYASWFEELRDRHAQARITTRIQRLEQGNPGDVNPVGKGVSEMRINYGPGYRVYFVQRGESLIILLAGGDKGSQDRDIIAAIDMASIL